MSRDSDMTEAEEALLVDLGQRARRLRLLAPEPLEAALSDPSEAQLQALQERVASHEELAWLGAAVLPLSAERQERLRLLAEAALGVAQPDRAAQPDKAAQPGRTEQPGRARKPRPAGKARRRFWPWLLVPLAAAAAIVLLLAWPGAEPPPRYALEVQLGDAVMLSPSAGRGPVSRGSLLQLVLRPPEVSQQRPVVLLYAGQAHSGEDGELRHVPVEVLWSEDGSARIRTAVAQAFPSHRGPARLLVVAAPAGTTAEDIAAQLRGGRSWPETWRRYELSIDVAP